MPKLVRLHLNTLLPKAIFDRNNAVLDFIASCIGTNVPELLFKQAHLVIASLTVNTSEPEINGGLCSYLV